MFKLFSYQEDIALDPFSGSGTTAIKSNDELKLSSLLLKKIRIFG